MQELGRFDCRRLNASAVGRALCVSHSTARDWIKFLQSTHRLWLLPDLEHPRRQTMVLRSPAPLARLIEILNAVQPGCQLNSLGIGRVRSVPVIADIGERVGFCFQSGPILRRTSWLPLVLALRRKVIARGIVLHTEPHASIKECGILAVPWDAFAAEAARWIQGTADEAARRAAVWRFNRERFRERLNRERLAAWAAPR